jgi:GDPmannose 4,6-dehydratase
MNTTCKKILITGVTGQDGSNMVRYLLNTLLECKIYGAVRRLSVANHDNIADIHDTRFELINMDLLDQQSIVNIVKKICPDYVINFAAQSFVGESWNSPIYTFSTNTLPVIYFLEAIKEYVPACRFYSAGSSEEMGDVEYSPQDINHPMKPRSPYGASKCAARHLVKVYRESYNLFNHRVFAAEKNLLHVKLAQILPELKRIWKLEFRLFHLNWGIFIPYVIGVIRKILWKQCGL